LRSRGRDDRRVWEKVVAALQAGLKTQKQRIGTLAQISVVAARLVGGDGRKQSIDVVQVVGVVEPLLLVGVRDPRACDTVCLVLARDLADWRLRRGHARNNLQVVAPLVSEAYRRSGVT
jgi:hypothetical protein